jgi:DNA processing protein
MRLQPVADRPRLPVSEKLAWIRLARTEHVGPVTFFRLIDLYKTASKALEKLPAMARRGGRVPVVPPLSVVEREMEALARMGGEILAACEEGYPISLTPLEDAPPVLTVLGDPALLSRPCVAIVGARNASLNGRRFAETLARDLGAAGHVVVSGLARGIDAAAHTGALETGTAAVLAGGVDVVYPEENRDLYRAVRERGAVVAESPPGFPPRAQDFPRRNRIVSGLSAGTVVVEASLRSGSLITARLAAEQGRDVFAVPGFPGDPRAQGPNALIRDGAVLVQGAPDILSHLNGFASSKSFTLRESSAEAYVPDPFESPPPEDAATLDDVRATILQNMSAAPVEVDDLVRSCQLTLPAAQVILLELELGGVVRRLPGNRVCLLGGAAAR